MGYILESLANYLILLIFFIAIEFLICLYYKTKGIKVSKGFVIGWQLLACLMTAILSVTGSGSITDVGNYGDSIIRTEEISLIPFQWGNGDIIGLILNVIMFIPFGILLPLLWKKGAGLKETVFISFLFSLLIEISQLFNFRATDIDDLLMNTLGGLIGYIIYRICFKKRRFFQLQNTKDTWIIKNSAFFTVIFIFLFEFFVGKSFQRCIWMIIYGA